GPLSRESFSRHIIGSFMTGRRTLENEAVESIYCESGERPGDVQELCNALWSITENDTSLNQADVADALQVVFSREKALYEHSVSGLTSNQLRCLVGVAHLGGKGVQSGGFLKFTGILHASSVKKAIGRLVDLKILYFYKKEYIFNSPFFRTWLKHSNI
ncbi:MAG: hypothetical protein QGG69_00745, partial [Kiritimatiellia bacterium]|nr:hypothetical protein [Kiritimatiellia bacterium]